VGALAVREASEGLRGKLLDHAGVMTGRRPRELALADGNVVLAGAPETPLLSLRELALDAFYHKDRGGQLAGEAGCKARTNARSFGCTFVDLEVDVPLCKVRIREIYNVHDSGVVINPLLARGQVHGGMAMGIGAALLETLLIDPDSGAVHNDNLLDYKVPTIMDVPDLGAAFVETYEPTHPYGAKSLGEPPVLSPAPAIRNAVLDATGVAINELPLDPKTLFRHFKNARLI
jgi:xanthine dehydrogenase molybdenum-binding subunit